MLKLSQITKTFHGLNILKNLSCTVEKGDFIIIMGPNGAGKTTLFDLISGKIFPDQGSLYMDDQDITHLGEKKRASFIGKLHQNTYLGSCANLTLRENLSMIHLKDKKASLSKGTNLFPKEVVETLLKPLNLNLEKLLDAPMGTLSGGQRQLIAFIMTILNPPKLLLLDEPTAALDPRSSTLLLSFVQRYIKEHQIPTLLITHDPLIAKHLGNKLWILQEGGIAQTFGMEKELLNPHEFFHAIDYQMLHSEMTQG